MKAVIDTNFYCLCDTGNKEALALLSESNAIWLPAVAYGELYYGFKHGLKFENNLRRLDQFIEKFAVTLIAVDRNVAEKFGEIFASLRKKGRPIPTNDIWISASTMEVGGTLLTSDKHFLDVAQIQVRLVS